MFHIQCRYVRSVAHASQKATCTATLAWGGNGGEVAAEPGQVVMCGGQNPMNMK